MITLKGITWDHARGYDPLIAASALYLEEKGVAVNWQKRSLTNFGDQSLEALSKQFDLIIMDHPHAGVAEASSCLLSLHNLLAASTLQELKNKLRLMILKIPLVKKWKTLRIETMMMRKNKIN